MVGRGNFLTQLGMGSGVSQSLCWPASRQGWGPADPRVGSGLLWVGWVCRLQDCDFLAFSVCPLVGEAGLEVTASFSEGRVGAGSWPSGGQGCVYRHIWRWLWAQVVFRQPVC